MNDSHKTPGMGDTSIAEQKQAEEALRAERDFNAALVEASPAFLVTIGGDDRIRSMNRAMLEALGYTLEEVVGQDYLTTVVSEAERPMLAGVFARLTELREPTLNENHVLAKDGRLILVEWHGRPMLKPTGEFDYFFGFGLDITERTRAEGESKHLASILESTTDLVAIADMEARIVYMNRAGRRMVGIGDDEDLTTTGIPDFTPQWALETVLNKGVPTAIQEGSWSGEGAMLARDGREIPVSQVIMVHRAADGTPQNISTIARDITEHKLAEAEVQRNQQLLQSFLNNFPDGAWAKDLEGHFLIANRYVVEDIYGLPVDKIIGKTVYDTFPKEVADSLWESEKRLLETGETIAVEEDVPQADGQVHKKITTKFPLYDVAGNINGLGGVLFDITERKQAEAKVQQEKLFSDTVINGLAGIFFLFDPQGKMVRWNEEYERALGYTTEETAARSALDPIADEDKENTAVAIGRVLTEGQASVEADVVTKDGKRIPYYFVGRRLQLGDQLYAVGTGVDITGRRRLEAQVQEALERRGYQVQISTEISQEVATASEISDLFGRVVTLTKERLGYYHTQLLRYDPTQDAVVLINGYGEIGQKMLAEGHALPMGAGLIGTAAATGQTIMRSTLAEDPDWQPHPLLPETKGEIAVPIKWQDTVLGVLDVQSNQAGALTEDDRLLLEGLCGQVAVAIEQTRLRQEMAERLEEVNRLYRSMSHEGWKTYRDTTDLPTGFMFDQTGTRPVDETGLADELFANIPMQVLGGEVVGTLTVANDPQHPTSPEDYAFLQQVSDQIALALESARLAAQTQSALAQTERLSEAGLRFSRAADLQELLVVVSEMLGISSTNRALLGVFNYSSTGELEGMDIVANWWNGSGHEPSEIGRHYSMETINILPLFISATPVFYNDTFHDERVNAATLELFTRQNIHSMAVLPLYLGSRQIGVLFLEAEEAHNFTQDETRLFSAMGPQIATVLENRRQFERAQKQAERESTLNVISQKIQSATTVEAVLQIAARELGHALGAPMTIAQLSMKAKQ